MPLPLAAVATKAAVQVGAKFLQSKQGKALIGGVVALAILIPVVFVGGAMLLIGSISGAQSGSASGEAARVAHCMDPDIIQTGADGGVLPAPGWDAAQTENATTIISVVKTVNLGGAEVTEDMRKRAGVIALATAMQESNLRNVKGGDRDSQGLFQQRPSQGWGTVEQITTPLYAATAFLYGVKSAHVPGLVDVSGWPDLPVTSAAQAVQRSGFPDAYAKHEEAATTLMTTLWDLAPPVTIPAELDRSTDTITTATGDTGVIAGGDSTCATNDWTPGEGQVVFGSWGNYSNGEIPANALCALPWQPSTLLRCDAAEAFTKLNKLWKADHAGQDIPTCCGYRSIERQRELKAEKGALAATPGKSNHGWGLAVDLSSTTFGGESNWSLPGYAWMLENAPKYGWSAPDWARENCGCSGPHEPWHWQYYGVTNPDTSKG